MIEKLQTVAMFGILSALIWIGIELKNIGNDSGEIFGTVSVDLQRPLEVKIKESP